MDFDIVIQMNPDATNTYQLRGECKIRSKDYPGALSDFDMSVSTLAAKGLVQYNAFEKRGRINTSWEITMALSKISTTPLIPAGETARISSGL